MKILFIARHFTYFRNYDGALRELARRGHRIHLAVEKSDALGGEAAVEALTREFPEITYGEAPDRTDDQWSDISRRLRLGLDYLRYLDPFYDTAPLRRVRARERTPQALIRLADPPLVGTAAWRRGLGRALHALDRAAPPPPATVEYLRAQQPDILLITPLVDLGSQQIDYLRAARVLGIPTGLAVWSWDHLSSKAYIRECPERVFVWNETQRHEAVHVHGVPADRVVVTGAQCFDHWFERRPSRTREEFCASLNLPADRPLVLYVCSGLIMGSPSEPQFVREWLTHLRASTDPRVATAAVLVRPHPGQVFKWDGVTLDDLGPVALWGGNPIDERSRADYFDSLYHSAAVVGLNTSAFIEAGIVGREVLTILPPLFHDNQEGTVHFQYLLQIGGGLLRVSREFDTHLAQLSEALARVPTGEHPHKAFLESFVRPHGLGVASTPTFVAAVEALASCRIAPADVAETSPASWRGRLLAGLVDYSRRPWAEPWVLSPREIESVARVRADAARKEAARLAHEQMREEQQRQKSADKERRTANRAERLEAKRAAKRAVKAQARAAAKAAKAAQRLAAANAAAAKAPRPGRQAWRARVGRLLRPLRQMLDVR